MNMIRYFLRPKQYTRCYSTIHQTDVYVNGMKSNPSIWGFIQVNDGRLTTKRFGSLESSNTLYNTKLHAIYHALNHIKLSEDGNCNRINIFTEDSYSANVMQPNFQLSQNTRNASIILENQQLLSSLPFAENVRVQKRTGGKEYSDVLKALLKEHSLRQSMPSEQQISINETSTLNNAGVENPSQPNIDSTVDLSKPIQGFELIQKACNTLFASSKFHPEGFLHVDIFCDGSYRKETGAWAYVVMESSTVWIQVHNKVDPLVDSVEADKPLTNNIAELCAIYHAMDFIKQSKRYTRSYRLFTDSTYAKGITVGQYNIRENVELATKCADMYRYLTEENGVDLSIHWVKAHAKVQGNEMADKLAFDLTK